MIGLKWTSNGLHFNELSCLKITCNKYIITITVSTGA